MITLKTLPQSTAQEVFDQVATHLLTQNQKSLQFCNDNILDLCMYRGAGTLKCAAGCLIADEEYDPTLEKASWKTLVKRDIVPKEHSTLIIDLQCIHDRTEVSEWKEELQHFAKIRKLEFKED